MRIQKRFQGTVPENKILNTDSASATDTYSCQKINEMFDSFTPDTPVGPSLTFDDIYPVGSIYMSVSSTSPSVLFGGIWEALPDRFLLGASSTYNVNSTGGSADAVAVAHSHNLNGTAVNDGTHTHGLSGSAASNGAHTHTTSGTAASNGGHTHTVSGTAETGGSHSHNVGRDRDCASGSANWSVHTAGTSGAGATSPTSNHAGHTHNVSGTAASNGAHTHTVSGTAASNGAHTHTLSGSATDGGAHTHSLTGTATSSGVDGTGKNMPPYLAVYMWQRIA